MSNISNEILKIRRTRLALLQHKYLDKLKNAPTIITKIVAQARVDELELQIISINKLLDMSLIPFSVKRKPITHEQARVLRRKKNKPHDQIVHPLPQKKTISKKLITIEEVKERKKRKEVLERSNKRKSLFQP